MSGFDTTMRSQAMVHPMRLDATIESGRALVGGANALLDTARFMKDYQLRKTESLARVAESEQTRQLNAVKLQQLQAIDFMESNRLNIELQREQLNSAKLANKAGEDAYEQQRQRNEALSPQEERVLRLNEMYSRMVRDPYEAAEMGMVPDEKTGLYMPTADKDKVEAFRKRVSEMEEKRLSSRAKAMSTAARDLNAETMNLRTQLATVQEMKSKADESEWPAYDQEIGRLLRELEHVRKSSMGDRDGQPSAGGQQTAPFAGKPGDMDSAMDNAGRAAIKALQGGRDAGFGDFGNNPQERDRIAAMVRARAMDLVGPGMPLDRAMEQAYRDVLFALRSGDPEAVKYVRGQ